MRALILLLTLLLSSCVPEPNIPLEATPQEGVLIVTEGADYDTFVLTTTQPADSAIWTYAPPDALVNCEGKVTGEEFSSCPMLTRKQSYTLYGPGLELLTVDFAFGNQTYFINWPD